MHNLALIGLFLQELGHHFTYFGGPGQYIDMLCTVLREA